MWYSEKMGKCALCGKSTIISDMLRVCVECLRSKPEKTESYIVQAHRMSRQPYHLPEKPPKDESGIQCKLCSNECMMGEEAKGFCGLRKTSKGKLESLVDADKAVLHAYRDPHITNCCSAWFCPAGTGSGYP
ncbi:MAG: radical SAM protein, partial [Candidatus Bathyarchaeia archaeon]